MGSVKGRKPSFDLFLHLRWGGPRPVHSPS